MRLYLVHHPAPVLAPGICHGQSDLALAEDAGGCAATLRRLLPADIPVHASPLRQCRELANLLHAAPTFDDRLKEIHFGAWEMRAWDDIPRAEIDAWSGATLEQAPPGGESVATLYRRVAEFMRERRTAGDETLVLVTHAGVMKVCCSLLLGLPDDEWQGMRFEYGTVSLIDTGQLLWHNKSDV